MAESTNRGRALRLLAAGAVGGGLVWAVCLALGARVAGVDGLGWAALGGGTTMLFFALGQLVQVASAEAEPLVVLVSAMVSYLVRVAGLAALLVLARPLASGPGSWLLATSMIAVLVGWLAAEIWAFARLRVPAFDPPETG